MINITKTMKRTLLITSLWVLLVLACWTSLSGVFTHKADNRVEAATSSTVNFQARLLTNTGALVPDGFYNVQFKLYSASSGGAAQWTETYYDSNGVTAGNDNRVRVVNGYLSVYLGSQTALPNIDWSQEEWLTLNIGGTAQTATPTWDGEMTPRLKLSAVPYAFTAGSLANTTGGNTSTLNWATQTAARSILLPDEAGTLCIQGSTNCGFALSSGSGSYIQNGTTPQTANFNITGNGTIGGTLQAPTVNATSAIQLNGTQIVDSNRNISNILTITASTTATANSGTSLEESLLLTANPSSAPAAQTDFIGIRSTTSSSSANVNSNTRFFGASTNASFSGSGTLGTSYGNFMQTSNASSGTITTAYGGNGVILNSSNGAITTGTALQGTINSTGTGTISSARALDANVINNGGGTLTNAYGLRVETPTNTGVGSSIGTAYGIYIGEQSAATTNYGLYFAGTAGTSIDGITWNGDTNLYRSNPAELTTNGDIVIQGGDLLTNQTTANLFATNAATVNIGTAATSVAGGLNLAGGSGNTGCSVNGNTGDFVCSGAISTLATTGTQGWWTRSGSTLSPVNSSDNINTSGVYQIGGSTALQMPGSSNLFVGGASNGSLSGSANNAFGVGALSSDTTGYSNSAFGTSNMAANISGVYNASFGNSALRYNTSGNYNAVLGAGAGTGVNGGSDITGNTLLGYNAGTALLTGGNYNTLVGYGAGSNLTTGAHNIIIGDSVNAASISGSNQLNIGNTIYGNTSVGSVKFQNTTNSSTAFQIQSSGVSGNLLFNGDTTNNRINIIGDVNIGNRYDNRLFSDNFEGGTLGLWDQGVSGSISTSTATVHAGKYSTLVNPSSGLGYASASIALNTTAYARAWVYVSSQTSSSAGLLNLQDTVGQSFTVSRLSSSGDLDFWDGVTNAHTDSGTVMSTGAWHLIEMRVTTGNPTGVSQVWLDGNLIVNLSSQNNDVNSLHTIKIGDSTGGRTFSAYFDDVVADTVPTGTASSLNVDDSFHVGGTATFGSAVLVQNTLSVGNLIPVTPGSAGTTSLSTVDSTGTVGQYSTVAMGLDGYPRISYYDTTNADLKFAQCTNATCTASNVNTLDSTGTVGQYNYLAIGSDGFARISYYDSTNADLKFIQCTNAACTTKNTNTIDSTGTVGQYSSVVMGLDGFARISYYDGTNGDLKYVQCTNAACTTNAITTVDSTGTVGQYSAIAVGSDGFARIAYRDNTNGLKMVQCTNAACTTNNITVVDSSTTGATWTSITMGSDGFARIAYYDSANTNLKFAQCKNATCSVSNQSIVDSADSVGQYTGITMGSDGYARISYYNATDGDLELAQCLNADCSNNNITTVDSVGTVGQYSSVAAGTDGYFYISYYDSTNGDLKLAQAGNAFTGSTIGSSSSPFGAIYGTTLNVQGAATFQQSVEIDNNLTVNGAVYVNGNIDSTTYSANGVAGLSLTCSGGSSLENAVVSGGIITGGDCINSSYARAYNSTNQTITTGTWTTLALNSETDDTDNYHSTVTNNSRLTVSTSGWYHITAQLVFPVNGTGSRQVRVLKNGTTIIGEAELPASAATNTQIPIDVQASLSATDYVEMQVNQNSGGNLATIALAAAGTNPDTYFAISKVQSGGAGVSNTLQQAYDMGNTLTTTTGRDIQFTLADTTTDSNFLINVASGSTSKFAIQNAGTDMFSVNPSTANISLGANNPGALQSWQTSSTSLPAARQDAVTVTANGYVYVIGGASTPGDGGDCEGLGGTITSTSYYAKLNADGTNGSWGTTTSVPTAVCDAMGVVANGYVYIAGGNTTSGDVSTVYFAKLNADGTIGTWRTNAQALPTARDGGTMVASNGYLYVLDGSTAWNGSGSNTLYYAQINVDGSTTGWTTVTGPRGTLWATAVTANGYLYLIGGYSSPTTVAYAPLNPSNGSIGTWNNTTSLPAGKNGATSVVANGYIYVMAGNSPTYNSASSNTVYYAKLSSNGTVGSWSSTSTLPNSLEFAGSIVVNGYVYVIGGQTAWSGGSALSSVYYASTQRIQVGGSLDLVGLAGGNLVDDNPYGYGSVGGSLTAGDTTIVGTIRVQGQATFNSSLTTNGVLTANGGANLSSIDVRRYDTSTENAIRLSTSTGNDWKIYQGTGTNNLTFWSDASGQNILTLDVNTGGALFKNAASGGDSNAFRVESYGGTDFYRADTLVGSNNFGANTNIFQPQADGNALQVKTTSGAGSLAIFTADTSGKNVQIGSSSTDGNAVLLTLDSYNTTDPAGTNGAMYYNSSTSKFRCYQNSTWRDCLSPWVQITKTADQDVTNSATYTSDSTLQFSVTAGVTYTVRFNICYAGNTTAGDYKGQFLFPAAIAAKNVSGRYVGTTAADAVTSSAGVLGATTTFPSGGLSMGTAASLTDKRIFEGDFTFQPNSSGTMNYQFAQNTATAGTSARTCANSFIEYQAL